MIRKLTRAGALALALVHAGPLVAQDTPRSTLEAVRESGRLRCGVVAPAAGFALSGEDGRWAGFDTDLCRAVAAAALGDGEKVEIVPLAAERALLALSAGEVAVLARGRPAMRGAGPAAVRFVTFALVDGQGFLVPARDGPVNALGLDGAEVCVRGDNAAEANLGNYARAAGVSFKAVPLPDLQSLGEAFTDGLCRAISADRLELAQIKTGAAKSTGDLAILPELLSREQTGPFVRDGDPGWFNLVKWTVFALIQAEESGVTKANVESLRATSQDPRIQRFLGVSGGLGGALGVADDWVVRIVGTVGNYAEIYGRHLGPGSPLGLERGPNALWSDGGLLHAMPFQ